MHKQVLILFSWQPQTSLVGLPQFVPWTVDCYPIPLQSARRDLQQS